MGNINFPFFKGDKKEEKQYLIVGLIALSTIGAFIISYFALINGISGIYPHFFYVPVILSSYFFLRKGLLFSLVISLGYFLETLIFFPYDYFIIFGAGVRSIVLLSVSSIIVFLVDKQRETEKDLKISQFAVDNSPDEIFYLDKSGNFCYVNETFCSNLGYSKDELIRSNISNFIPGFCPVKWNEFYSLVKKDGIKTFETYQTDSGGKKYPVEVKVFSRDYDNQELLYFFSRNILERKLFEESLQKSEREITLILNSISEGLIFLDTDFRVIGVNRAIENLFEKKKEEIIGKKCHEIFYGRNEFCEKCIAQMSLSDKNFQCGDFESPIGRIFRINSNPVFDEEGEFSGIVESVLDITDKKSYEKALKNSNKKLNLLSSITRHDILNQVTAIKLAGDLIAYDDKIPPESETAEYIQMILESVEVINKQISFTKDYEELGIELADWQDVSAIIKNNYANKIFESFNLKCDIPDFEVFADPMFKKVIFNMFDNSLRHGVNVTSVKFSFIENEDNGVLVYEDNGQGVLDDKKSMIFEKGFGSNTGLGLYLSKEILGITDISITENGVYGKGVRFEIIIPSKYWRMKNQEH
ncbi:PAS domain S-box protein [Methanoplanus sp. FWC-SCC4]|uniref:PAS domain S-box protein n=1 Tax=Methanochimaera problematica TaxID=2609417 RepID=A0AA97FC16_9EURY|nr:PAS domain S-box protein [Methanoplanus sp. FWC-SCC4]WOF16107.1 PAS domain S-box protein [Methanoplanus sp. FWC-SCC4]